MSIMDWIISCSALLSLLVISLFSFYSRRHLNNKMKIVDNVEPFNVTFFIYNTANSAYMVVLCFYRINNKIREMIPQAPYLIKHARKIDYILAWLAFVFLSETLFVCLTAYFYNIITSQ